MECSSGICGGDPPGVTRHPKTGRPWIVGTEVYVEDVIAALELDGSHARVARSLGLTLHQVRVAEAWSQPLV
jgi:uncharacterized protein (DUF433 family)